MSILKEFRDFAMKGNVIDLAVGLIIGAAFGAIVTSMVNDVIMPPIGKAIGGVNFSELQYSLGKTEQAVEKVKPDGTIETETIVKEAYINYGRFIQKIIDFLIIAMAVFMIVKLANKAQSAFDKQEAKDETPKAPPEDIVLLREIRDALKK